VKRITTEQTDFQKIEVWGSAQEIEFRVAGAIHATWHQQRFLTGMAWDAITAGVLLRAAGPPKKLLMLGLGGGTALRQLKHLIPNLEITALELDGRMISLAKKFMHVDELGVNVIHGDAYAWLRTNTQRFDAIVDDVYGSGELDVSRPTVYTPELARALQRSLAKGGVFAANLVTGHGHRKMQGAFRTFCTQTWPVVRSIAPHLSLNETLVAGVSLAPPRNLKPYEYLWPHQRDQALWRELRCRRLR
jgi:spermidine synthase